MNLNKDRIESCVVSYSAYYEEDTTKISSDTFSASIKRHITCIGSKWIIV